MSSYQQQPYNAFGYQNPDQSFPQQQQQHTQAGGSGDNYYNLSNGNGNGYYGYANGQGIQHQQLNQQQQQQQQHYTPQYQQQLNQFQPQGHQQQQHTVQPQAIHGNSNGHTVSHQPYDPFQLGVMTGAGIHYNAVQQQQQYQQYYALNPVPQQPATLDPNLHRPALQPTISPSDSQPGSNASSHRNLHSVTPERLSTHSPDADDRISPIPGTLTGAYRPTRQKEGPVKAACLSCRHKKMKCDGAQPICLQVCPHRALTSFFRSIRSSIRSARRRASSAFTSSLSVGERERSERVGTVTASVHMKYRTCADLVVVAPSALQEFLKKLDVLLSVHDPSLSPGTSEANDDTAHVVRQFTSRDEV